MTISNLLYQNTHGKMPRGYGWWAFKLTDDKNQNFYLSINSGMMLKDAKKMALKEAKQLGNITFIQVAP